MPGMQATCTHARRPIVAHAGALSYRGPQVMYVVEHKRLLLACLAIAVALASACDRSPSEPPAPKPRSTSNPLESLPADNDPSFRFQAAGRVVALGDVHGDLDATRRALRLAGAIDDANKWVGGKLVVVQTGDVLDRGDDERAILDLLVSLRSQAKAAGGALVSLLGNHETMNVAGDFRYVTPGGFRAFFDVPTEGIARDALAKLPEPSRPRAAAFFPGGVYAKHLATFAIVAVVNDTVFVHGGVLPSHVRYGIGNINRETQAWLNGERDAPPKLIGSEDGPLWTRRYSTPKVEAHSCGLLSTVLDRLGAKRMVVGHTPQNGGISSACDDKVWRIDVGLAKHYGGGPSQVLSISDGRVEVLREKPEPAPKNAP